MKKVLVLCTITLVVLCGCGKKTNDNSSNVPVEIKVDKQEELTSESNDEETVEENKKSAEYNSEIQLGEDSADIHYQIIYDMDKKDMSLYISSDTINPALAEYIMASSIQVYRDAKDTFNKISFFSNIHNRDNQDNIEITIMYIQTDEDEPIIRVASGSDMQSIDEATFGTLFLEPIKDDKEKIQTVYAHMNEDMMKLAENFAK